MTESSVEKCVLAQTKESRMQRLQVELMLITFFDH